MSLGTMHNASVAPEVRDTTLPSELPSTLFAAQATLSAFMLPHDVGTAVQSSRPYEPAALKTAISTRTRKACTTSYPAVFSPLERGLVFNESQGLFERN